MSGTGGSASGSDCESDQSDQFFVSLGGKRLDDQAPSNFGAPEQTKLVSGTGGSANFSVPNESEDAESNGSEDSSNRTSRSVLMMIKTEREAAANVEPILVREAGLDPAKHFKLAEQLARALLHAQTVERDFWPKDMNARELESMRGRHSDKISQHMDVPADMLHLLTDGRFWTRILEAALHGSPGMLPVKHSSTRSVLARMDPTGSMRGTQDDHAHLFTLNNGDKMLLLVGVTHWQWINAANGASGFYNRMFALAVRSAESDDNRSLEDYKTTRKTFLTSNGILNVIPNLLPMLVQFIVCMTASTAIRRTQSTQRSCGKRMETRVGTIYPGPAGLVIGRDPPSLS